MKNPATDCYTLSGEDLIRFAETFRQKSVAAAQVAADKAAVASAIPEEDEGEEIDETQRKEKEKDIELVMQQAKVTRSRAEKALLDNNNDVVDAIMELTRH